MARKKGNPDVLPKDREPSIHGKVKKPGAAPAGEIPAVASREGSRQGCLEHRGRVLNFLVSLFTLITLLIGLTSHLDINWIPFCLYLVSIALVGQRMFVSGSQMRPLWEHGVVVAFCVINTALFFLWVPTWWDHARCGLYGIRIDSPKSSALVGGTFTVSGSYWLLPPPQDSLVLMNESVYKKEYWPEVSPIEVDYALRKWSADFVLVGGTGTTANVDIALVGEPGRALYTYYKDVNDGKPPPWISIPFLTDDMAICDTIQVTEK